MSEYLEMRLAGSGGQGLILASIILAEAALSVGRHVAQSQSYGPEARGGLCKAEVVISGDTIRFPKVRKPNFLLALTQSSLDLYSKNFPKNCTVMVDSELTVPAHLAPSQVIRVPILQAAREQVGKPVTANIIAVAAINHLYQLVPADELWQIVRHHVPAGAEEINHLALNVGMELPLNREDAPTSVATG